MVVCAGGENYKTSEYFILNKSKKWENLSAFNSKRWNSSLAYVNKKYLYAIGGYTGTFFSLNNYLSNIEYIDLDNKSQNWKEINLTIDSKFNSDSIGVIPIKDNYFLLVGGYHYPSANDYFYSLEVSDKNPENTVVEKVERKLPRSCCFTHGPFLKINNNAFNTVDSRENIFCYDYSNDVFYTIEGERMKEK